MDKHRRIADDTMAVSSGPAPEAYEAAVAAMQRFVVEAFTLLGIEILVTTLRTYARVKTVGFRELSLDDLLAWLAMFFAAAETAIAYTLGPGLHGLGNSNMTPEQRISIDPDSDEYRQRILGSQLPLAAWMTYLSALWCLKGALLVFYRRLTVRLGRGYEIRLHIGTAILAISFVVVTLNLFLSCRPLHRFWQINPDPGNLCYAALSRQIILVVLSLNVITDAYLLTIPLPMLWKVKMRILKKSGLLILFSGGIVVIVFGALRCTAILSDPQNGGQQAGNWAIRETFAAIITTNLPVIFPLVNHWLWPWIGTWMTSIGYSNKNGTKREDSELATFDRMNGADRPGGGQQPRGPNHVWNSIGSDSEECITQPALTQGQPARHT